MHFTTTFALAASLVSIVSGHGLITSATGANGVTGKGFAVVDGTPRDTGLPIKKVEGDTSIIRNNEIKSGKAQACGRTEFNGNTDIASELAAADAAGLPSADSSGTLSFTLHQVNQDGAGPYACDVSGDGGQTFQAATVTNNVPGVAGLSLSAAKDFNVQATAPAGTTCAGGPSGNACILRCKNQALAGPFGGCVAFTMGGAASGAAAAGNATAPAAAAPAAAAAAAPAAAAPAAAAKSAAAKGAAGGGLAGLKKLFGRENFGGARVAGALLRSIRELEQ